MSALWSKVAGSSMKRVNQNEMYVSGVRIAQIRAVRVGDPADRWATLLALACWGLERFIQEGIIYFTNQAGS